MALTSDYHQTVQDRIRRDLGFREALLEESVRCLLADEVGVVRILLRDHIVATVGFERLGDMMGKSPESLERMLGPEGAPSAGDLLEVIACTLRREGLILRVSTAPGPLEVDGAATTESVAAR